MKYIVSFIALMTLMSCGEAEPIQEYHSHNSITTMRVKDDNVATGAASELNQVDEIFIALEELIVERYTGVEQKKWLYILRRLREDNTVGVNQESFNEFALYNKGEVLNGFKQIKNIEEFPNLHNQIVHAEVKRLDAEGKRLDAEGKRLDAEIKVIDAGLELLKNMEEGLEKK